ncbi:hypothetical protein HX116_12065 [Acinetobacter towneri]|uniref:hypothetical protein n=1 Tax=Acinetobacter towneri TaxID=202956 RepID=UPI0025790325|nr:hypothetical protein [Acinetobacter towneri]MDM1734532.1 hypothetical protein [Acinetobacter towneri]
MSKKTLKEKINDVAFWAIIFLILYLIVGYLLESAWLSKQLELNEIYDLLKDGFTITAAFLAPVAAFILFSDWREQHNKQVINEFALKVFRRYEHIEKAIQEAKLILTNLEVIVPYESQRERAEERRPIYIDDEIYKENEKLFFSFKNKIGEIQEVINLLLDDLVYYGVVANKVQLFNGIVKKLADQYIEIHIDGDDDVYSEYIQLLDLCTDEIDQYCKLRDTVTMLVITDLLMALKAD